MFSKQHIDMEQINDVSIESAVEEIDPPKMILIHMDGTVQKKKGRRYQAPHGEEILLAHPSTPILFGGSDLYNYH